MTTTTDTDEQVGIEADKIHGYIKTNGDELYQFFMANLSSLETVCHLMVHHRGNHKAWPIIEQQIDQEVKTESYDKARQRIYG